MSNKVPVSLIVNILVVLLPLFGVQIGNQALTDTIQTLVTLVTGFIIYFEHKKVSAVAGLK